MKSDTAVLKVQTLSEKLAVAAVIAFLATNGIIAFGQIKRLRLHTNRVELSFTLLRLMDSIESTLNSVETGQRGFVITGQEVYLAPFNEAVKTLNTQLSQVATLVADDPEKDRQIDALQPLVQQKMEELASAITVRRNQDLDQIQALIANNEGKPTMDSIIAVEDMRALRVIMSRLLERLGHEVQVAEDGLQALDILSTFDAEIVFSDIAMPGMTGYDFARKLRQHAAFADTYLIAMTGYGQLSDRNLSHESGFNEHIVKPVDINKLRELFERLTRSLRPKYQ